MEQRIASRIKEELGIDVDVQYVDVPKNNGIVQKGYSITKCGDQIGVNMYINPNDTEDEIIESVVEHYSEVYNDHPINGSEIVDNMCNVDYIYANVFPTVISRSANDEMLKDSDIYHEEYFDMSVIYRVITNFNDMKGTFRLTQSLIDKLDLDMNIVKEKAMENLERSTSIIPLKDIMIKAGYPIPDNYDMSMYVVSNESIEYGSAAMMSEGVMQNIHDMTGSDRLYILPSSVYELIVLPSDYMSDDEEEDLVTLKNMVRMVNDSEVALNDRLTYSVYVHSRDGRMEVA